MGQENRRQRRLAIQLNAKVEAQGISWKVRISNFCSGGLFLEHLSTRGSVNSGFRQPFSGEKIVVSFVTPGEGEPRYHHVAAKVAHVVEEGFGVQFLERKEAALRGLLTIHRRQHAKAPQRKPSRRQWSQAQRKTFFREMQGLVEGEMIAGGGEVITHAAEVMTSAADRAKELEEQGRYRKAGRVLEERREGIVEKWLEQVAQAIGKVGEASPRGDDGGDLSLVDERSFDEWVAAVGLGSRLQADFSTPLYALEQRLSALLGNPVTKDNNPLDPSAFIMAFIESVEEYDFDLVTQRLLLGGMGMGLRPLLERIYEQVNQYLVEREVLPELALRVEKKNVKSAKPRPEPQGEGGKGVDRAEGPSGSGKGNGRSRSPFTSLAKLFKPKQQQREEGEEKEEEPPRIEREAVLGALKRIGDGETSKALKDRVRASLESQGEHGELLDEVEGALDASENLISSIRSDVKVQGGIGDLVGRLDVPLARIAIEQPDFLADQEHPATQLMGDLERLSVVMSGDAGETVQARQLKQVIDDTLGRLATDQRESNEAFAQAREELAPYVARVEHQVDTNIKRVVDTHQGEERLLGAKQQVASEINQRVAERPVSRALVQLIRLGWDNLLVLTLLHKGVGDEWQRYLGVLDTLAKWLQHGKVEGDPPRVARLLKIIGKGFEETPSQPMKQEKFLALLKKALASPQLFARVAAETVSYRYAEPEQQSRDEEPDPESRNRLAPLIQTIRGIASGDWVVERQSSGISRPLSLVWRDPPGNRFAFVDGKGVRALEDGVYGLAGRFERAELSILEDGGLPLVQRAVQDVLQRTYNQLLKNSETDELTGLFNRRSFSRELRRLMEDALGDNSRHVLLLVDIDQFKLTNDICGHEGGDRLLVETANILKTYLGDQVVLGRLGDDEFGALIRYCSSDDGFRLAETQRRAMENYTFNWQGRKLSPTVSVGLVAFAGSSDDPSVLLKQVDTACYLAKKAGRNRVKVFEEADQEVVEHTDEMAAATLVEDVIQQGKLRLYGQLISPVFMDDGLEEHYEVLLRVLDDKGLAASPEGLIKAAEGYQRMRTIDRWVIETLFTWLETHRDRVSVVGGFSINLSGQSIDDEKIIQFITDKLTHSSYPAHRISFEITETAMINDMGRAKEMILGIKKLGCQFYLDDFGSGLASYTYLKDLPVDCVKIDGSFVKNINNNDNDYALVKSITETAHFMKKRVIAEFVTDESIMIRLRELEVDYAQGYDVGKPFDLTALVN